MNNSWYPLLGEHDLTIDDKGRLLVPSDVRKRLEQYGENDTLVLMNFGGRIHLYPERFFMTRFGQLRTGIVPTVDELRLMRGLFGASQRLQWDKQGRILLSPKTIGQYKLDREITMVCNGDHLELWNRPDWANEQLGLAQDVPALIDRMADRFVVPPGT